MRAIIELMRWTDLRIGDALMCAKSRIQGSRFSLTTQKGRSALTVLIPDHVIAALNALPARADVHSGLFLLEWKLEAQIPDRSMAAQTEAPERLSLHREGRWNTHEISLAPVARHLSCHSASGWHQHAGFVQDASAQVGKDYRSTISPWVPERQAAFERRMAEALVQMGVSVSL
jgi:hypothetical protein